MYLDEELNSLALGQAAEAVGLDAGLQKSKYVEIGSAKSRLALSRSK